MEIYSLDRQKGNNNKEGGKDTGKKNMHRAMIKEMEGKTAKMRERRKKQHEETKKMTT